MAGETKVTRIKASDDAPKKKAVTTKASSSKEKAPKPQRPERRNVFAAIGGYFKGSWEELKQVRWPTRQATWSLTLAVLVFTIFFVVLISLLDLGFKALFELIIN